MDFGAASAQESDKRMDFGCGYTVTHCVSPSLIWIAKSSSSDHFEEDRMRAKLRGAWRSPGPQGVSCRYTHSYLFTIVT